MVQKGNRDLHRSTYSGGVKAVETSKWGADKARERYGAPKVPSEMNNPKDMSYPQFREDGRGPDWKDHTAKGLASWVWQRPQRIG
jgi:hypothetical protein